MKRLIFIISIITICTSAFSNQYKVTFVGSEENNQKYCEVTNIEDEFDTKWVYLSTDAKSDDIVNLDQDGNVIDASKSETSKEEPKKEKKKKKKAKEETTATTDESEEDEEGDCKGGSILIGIIVFFGILGFIFSD
jgi:hypothetical protein